jgi:hypothetical protein
MARRKPSQVAVQNATPKVDEKYAYFKVVIKPSKIHRWGLYAFGARFRRMICESFSMRVSKSFSLRYCNEADL